MEKFQFSYYFLCLLLLIFHFSDIDKVNCFLYSSLLQIWLFGWQSQGQLRLMAFEQEELWETAAERIPWHEKLEGEQAIQNRVHEYVIHLSLAMFVLIGFM